MIQFKAITEENFGEIIRMKRPEGETFVASNAYSLAQAWLYRDAGDVYPFAIYHDGMPVGFMMLDCHPDNKRAWHVYEKAGFRDTGEVENGECLLRLDF